VSAVVGPVRVTLSKFTNYVIIKIILSVLILSLIVYPAMVRVKVVNATALLVSWDALRNTHHYTIYYSAFSPELFKVVDESKIVVPSTRTSDTVVVRELTAGVEHQFQVTASLEVQGEMYESGKSILTKIVIGKNFACICTAAALKISCSCFNFQTITFCSDEAAFHLQMGPVSPCTTWSVSASVFGFVL